VKEARVNSGSEAALSLRLRATPDSRFLEYGHAMTLAFRRNPGRSLEDAWFRIDLNDEALGRFEAARVFARSRAAVSLKIPAERLRTENVLSIVWESPSGSSASEPAAWLLPESEFYLPRDYRAKLPDLKLLQSGLFPLGLRSGLQDLVIVLPDGSGREFLEGLLELASAFGRIMPGDRFAFQVRRESDVTDEMKASSHFVYLRAGDLKDARSAKTVARVQERASPWNPRRYILDIQARSPATLRGAVADMFSNETLKKLSGDTAFLSGGGAESFRTNPAEDIYEYSYLIYPEAWLRENWLALPAILVAASVLLFAGLRLALRRYKQGRGSQTPLAHT
jgi:hypothetical protein